jgi:hypothetical protein
MDLVGGIALFFLCLVVIYFIFWGGGLTQFASLFDWGYRPTHGTIIAMSDNGEHAQNVRRNGEERTHGIRTARLQRP